MLILFGGFLLDLILQLQSILCLVISLYIIKNASRIILYSLLFQFAFSMEKNNYNRQCHLKKVK